MEIVDASSARDCEPEEKHHNNSSFHGDDHGGEGSDLDRAPPRFPRWTRQEIVVLIEGKRVEETKGRRYNRVFDNDAANSSHHESKWCSISNYCKRHGVNREAVQCRKRWSTLSRDYKRIKEWERANRDHSFWVLRNDARRESKLPGFFDRDLYSILDRAFAGFSVAPDPDADADAAAIAAVVKEEEEAVVFDSRRPGGVEEGTVLSDVEHSPQEEIPESPPDKEIVVESPSITPLPGIGSEKPPTLTPEKGSASKTAGQKRARVSSEENSSSDVKQQILSILERNGRVLSAHVEAHNLNCQLDRNQRSEQAESLIGVLGKLADALGRIADKLA